MAVLTKICGLSTPETVEAALAGGAAYLGFMLFPKSPRAVTPRQAAALAAPARGRAKVVAVMVDPEDEAVMDAVTLLRPDFIQLHGSESPRRTAEVAALSAARIIRALPVSTSADLDAAMAFERVADHLMFDAAPPKDAERTGGHGTAFDWSLLAGRTFARPWLLAGGLNPDNVVEAIRATGAPIVDVSSGVESAPGVKDAGKIATFLEAVRRL